MRIRVVILPDGQISVFTDEGSFAEGKEKIEAVFAALQVKGIQFVETSPVEQHRHDHEPLESHTHTHSH